MGMFFKRFQAVILGISLVSTSLPARQDFRADRLMGSSDVFSAQAIVEPLSSWSGVENAGARVRQFQLGLRERFIRAPQREFVASRESTFVPRHRFSSTEAIRSAYRKQRAIVFAERWGTVVGPWVLSAIATASGVTLVSEAGLVAGWYANTWMHGFVSLWQPFMILPTDQVDMNEAGLRYFFGNDTDAVLKVLSKILPAKPVFNTFSHEGVLFTRIDYKWTLDVDYLQYLADWAKKSPYETKSMRFQDFDPANEIEATYLDVKFVSPAVAELLKDAIPKLPGIDADSRWTDTITIQGFTFRKRNPWPYTIWALEREALKPFIDDTESSAKKLADIKSENDRAKINDWFRDPTRDLPLNVSCRVPIIAINTERGFELPGPRLVIVPELRSMEHHGAELTLGSFWDTTLGVVVGAFWPEDYQRLLDGDSSVEPLDVYARANNKRTKIAVSVDPFTQDLLALFEGRPVPARPRTSRFSRVRVDRYETWREKTGSESLSIRTEAGSFKRTLIIDGAEYAALKGIRVDKLWLAIIPNPLFGRFLVIENGDGIVLAQFAAPLRDLGVQSSWHAAPLVYTTMLFPGDVVNEVLGSASSLTAAIDKPWATEVWTLQGGKTINVTTRPRPSVSNVTIVREHFDGYGDQAAVYDRENKEPRFLGILARDWDHSNGYRLETIHQIQFMDYLYGRAQPPSRIDAVNASLGNTATFSRLVNETMTFKLPRGFTEGYMQSIPDARYGWRFEVHPYKNPNEKTVYVKSADAPTLVQLDFVEHTNDSETIALLMLILEAFEQGVNVDSLVDKFTSIPIVTDAQGNFSLTNNRRSFHLHLDQGMGRFTLSAERGFPEQPLILTAESGGRRTSYVVTKEDGLALQSITQAEIKLRRAHFKWGDDWIFRLLGPVSATEATWSSDRMKFRSGTSVKLQHGVSIAYEGRGQAQRMTDKHFGGYLELSELNKAGKKIGQFVLIESPSDPARLRVGTLNLWGFVEWWKSGNYPSESDTQTIAIENAVSDQGELVVLGQKEDIVITGLERLIRKHVILIPRLVDKQSHRFEFDLLDQVHSLTETPDYRLSYDAHAKRVVMEYVRGRQSADSAILVLMKPLLDYLSDLRSGNTDPARFNALRPFRMTTRPNGDLNFGKINGELVSLKTIYRSVDADVTFRWIEPERPDSGALMSVTFERKQPVTMNFFLSGERPYLIELPDRQLQDRSKTAIKALITEELEDVFGEDQMMFMATRYSLDIRNLMWSLLGPKLKGRYNEEQIQEIFNDTLVGLIDQRLDREQQSTPRWRPVGGLATDDSTFDDWSEAPAITQENIILLAETLETQLTETKNHYGLNDTEMATAEARVTAVLRRLEEMLFYKTYLTGGFDVNIRGQIDQAYEDLATRNPPPLVEKAFMDLMDDIENALKLQATLETKGLSPTTRLSVFQLIGVQTLWKNNHYLNGDEMGLGKTLEALSTFLLSDETELTVIAPKEALRRWMEDIADHLHLPLEIVLATTKEPENRLSNRKDISIVSLLTAAERYGYFEHKKAPTHGRRIILINDESLKSRTYRELKPNGQPLLRTGMLVIDEAHRFKNPLTEMAQMVYGDQEGRGAIVANRILPMSGTPLENEPSDVLPPLQYIARASASSPIQAEVSSDRLTRDFTTKSFRDLKKALGSSRDLTLLSTLGGYLARHLLRRTKSLVMSGLPPKVDHQVFVEPEKAQYRIDALAPVPVKGTFVRQQQLYETALQNPEMFEGTYNNRSLISPEEDDEEIDRPIRGQEATQLLRLEQTALMPQIFDRDADSIKMAAAEDLVSRLVADGKHVLVFSNLKTATFEFNRRMTNRLGRHFTSYVDGSVTDGRSEEIRRFQSGTSKVLTATIETMSLSQQLTRADAVVFLNYPWKPSTMNQAIDRAHRYEQDKTIHFPGKQIDIYHLIYDVPGFSIDREKARLVHRKSIIAQMLLDGNLSPELLKAFYETDGRLVDEIHRAQNPVEPDSYELEQMRRFSDVLHEILTSPLSDLSSLWDEASTLYLSILEHKSSFFANMAALDLMSQFPAIQSEIQHGKVAYDVLDLASGPSTLTRAYLRKMRELAFRARHFTLRITSFDHSSGMLQSGKDLPDQKILGDLDHLSDVIPGEARYDIVNLSYALRFSRHPARLIRAVHKLLRPGGRLQFILPSSHEIPPDFIAAMARAGFAVEVDPAYKLTSQLDSASRAQFVEAYGKEVADDMANEVRARFTYLRAVKVNPTAEGTLNDSDFQIYRRVPALTSEKVTRLKTSAGRYRLVPDDASVAGGLTVSGATPTVQDRMRYLERGFGKLLQKVTNLTTRHQKETEPTAAASIDQRIRAVLTSIETFIETNEAHAPLWIQDNWRVKLVVLRDRDRVKKWFNNDTHGWFTRLMTKLPPPRQLDEAA